MRKTRRRFLAAVGATLAIAGCQDDGGGPTPEISPDGTAGEGPTAGEGDGVTATDDGVGDGTPTEGDGVGDETGTDGAGTDGAAGATVEVSDHEEYGEILVDGEGMTLYVFERDTQDEGASTCTDDCATNWPPFTAEEGEAEAGEDVEAEVSTFERGDGTSQVSANGWPLYYYAEDAEAGDAEGQGVGDNWWVVDPSGEPITDGAGTGTGTGTPTGTAE